MFPWGPKQLEYTLRWPIEALWERPKRVAAADLSAQSIGAGLEQDGLTLVSDVKLTYEEYALAQDRVGLADRALTELNAMAGLMDSRFQAGDVSQLEARTAAIDAARARQEVGRAKLDVAIRGHELRARLGLALEADAPLVLAAAPANPLRGDSDTADGRTGRASRRSSCRTGDRSGGGRVSAGRNPAS